MIPIIFPHPNGSGTALRGTPLIGFACLATLLNAWEQYIFIIKKKMWPVTVRIEYKKAIKNWYKIDINLYIMRVPKLAGGPGRENQSTGSGGAPKF